MPFMTVRGARLQYEILGSNGPWVALSPGGRRPMASVRGLAQRLAAAGHRVLIHDRRNCGASDVLVTGSVPEYRVWADDLHAMLSSLDALPAVIGGASSGARLSLIFALAYPKAVRALLLWRVTGGRFAAERLARQYYGQYLAAAQQGGMAAVCATEHFAERIRERPELRAQLMATDAGEFRESMARWSDGFLAEADRPVIGATAGELRSIAVPTLFVPGNDRTHGRAIGEAAHALVPSSEIYHLFPEHVDVDLVPPEEWAAKDDELAGVFVDFLKRRLPA